MDDFDAALDRLDELLYGGEPDEPDWAWYDRPTPRQRRRARHREWQRRDRESRRGKPLPVFDVRPSTLGRLPRF